MLRTFLMVSAALLLFTCAADSADAPAPVVPSVTVLELVFANDDGMNDADAFVGPAGATIEDCKRNTPAMVESWKMDHPHAVLVEAFCVQHPDPAALMAIYRAHQPQPESTPAPKKHIPRPDET